MNSPNSSFEVNLHGTQKGRRDFNQPSRAEGLHSVAGGLRPHVHVGGCPETHQAGLVSELPVDARGATGQALGSERDGSAETGSGLDCGDPCCKTCALLDKWDEFLPIEREAFKPTFSDSELRAFSRRPSKIRRFYEASTALVFGWMEWRWHQFKVWRKSNSPGAETFRALEYGVLFTAGAFLFLYCIALACVEVAR